jgi:hypothetical protein
MIENSIIEVRIAVLEKELESFLAKGNATVQAYQTAIGELKRLIESPPTETEYIEPAIAERTHES